MRTENRESTRPEVSSVSRWLPYSLKLTPLEGDCGTPMGRLTISAAAPRMTAKRKPVRQVPKLSIQVTMMGVMAMLKYCMAVALVTKRMRSSP